MIADDLLRSPGWQLTKQILAKYRDYADERLHGYYGSDPKAIFAFQLSARILRSTILKLESDLKSLVDAKNGTIQPMDEEETDND
jgi:hypothetical protein